MFVSFGTVKSTCGWIGSVVFCSFWMDGVRRWSHSQGDTTSGVLHIPFVSGSVSPKSNVTTAMSQLGRSPESSVMELHAAIVICRHTIDSCLNRILHATRLRIRLVTSIYRARPLT